MEIKSKFKLGQEVFYPGADLGNPHIIKAKITGVTADIDKATYYNTEYSYRIPEENLRKHKAAAKVRLMNLLEERQNEIIENMKEAIKIVGEKKPQELIDRGNEIRNKGMEDLEI
jgi:hypothetical protein